MENEVKIELKSISKEIGLSHHDPPWAAEAVVLFKAAWEYQLRRLAPRAAMGCRDDRELNFWF